MHSQAVSEYREPAPEKRRPLCAFCDAPYTDAMIAWMGPDKGCGCCGGTILAHWPIQPAPEPRAKGDLCCEACGRLLYTAP